MSRAVLLVNGCTNERSAGLTINQPMPVRNCQLDVWGRAYREGISEQNPDQSEIEKDDYENGTAKRQRKKLF